MVGPSPVTSNGTEATEIEDDVADDMMSPQDGDPTQHSEVRQLKVARLSSMYTKTGTAFS